MSNVRPSGLLSEIVNPTTSALVEFTTFSPKSNGSSVGVGPGSGVGVGVTVGSGVGVGVGLGFHILNGVTVGLRVGVGAGVAVASGVGLDIDAGRKVGVGAGVAGSSGPSPVFPDFPNKQRTPTRRSTDTATTVTFFHFPDIPVFSILPSSLATVSIIAFHSE